MSCAGPPPPGTCRLSGRRLRLPCPWESGLAGLSPPSSLPPGFWLTPGAPSPECVWPRARGSGRGRCPDEAELALTEAGGLRAWRRGTASVWDTDGVWSQQPPGCRVESGSRGTCQAVAPDRRRRQCSDHVLLAGAGGGC